MSLLTPWLRGLSTPDLDLNPYINTQGLDIPRIVSHIHPCASICAGADWASRVATANGWDVHVDQAAGGRAGCR